LSSAEAIRGRQHLGETLMFGFVTIFMTFATGQALYRIWRTEYCGSTPLFERFWALCGCLSV